MVLKKEDIVLVAQLFHTMKELSEKLEEFHLDKDMEGIEKTKREMLKIQERIDEVL